jgi:hypothetical protein
MLSLSLSLTEGGGFLGPSETLPLFDGGTPPGGPGGFFTFTGAEGLLRLDRSGGGALKKYIVRQPNIKLLLVV